MRINYDKLLSLIAKRPSDQRICMIPILLALKEKGYVKIKGVVYFV